MKNHLLLKSIEIPEKFIALKHFIPIIMSLLSLLFGCGKRTDKPQQNLPWFPEIDNLALKVQEIPLDSDYVVETFLVSRERKEIFVLTYKLVEERSPEHLTGLVNYQLLCFNANGTLRIRKELPRIEMSVPAHLWIEHYNLVLFLNDKVRLYNVESLELTEEIPYYSENAFPTSANLEELVPEEQMELYPPARAEHLKNCSSIRVLNLPKAGGCVLLVKDNHQQRSIWPLIDSSDVDQFSRQYGMIEPPINPGWSYHEETGLYQMKDQEVYLETTAMVSIGTQLVYPNYKERSAIQYRLLVNEKTARFATTNRSGKPLYVQTSENEYLSTSGKEAWIAYRGILYRLE